MGRLNLTRTLQRRGLCGRGPGGLKLAVKCRWGRGGGANGICFNVQFTTRGEAGVMCEVWQQRPRSFRRTTATTTSLALPLRLRSAPLRSARCGNHVTERCPPFFHYRTSGPPPHDPHILKPYRLTAFACRLIQMAAQSTDWVPQRMETVFNPIQRICDSDFTFNTLRPEWV